MCPAGAAEPQLAPLPIVDLSDADNAAALVREAAASHGFFYSRPLPNDCFLPFRLGRKLLLETLRAQSVFGVAL